MMNSIVIYLLLKHTLGEGNGTPLQYSCLENPMDREAWWAVVHRVSESRIWLSDFIFTFLFHALEKEMATHSSVLAWRIPGMGDPDGLPSMGSQSWTQLKWLSSKHTVVCDLPLFSGHQCYAICDDVCTKFITLFSPYRINSLYYFVTFASRIFSLHSFKKKESLG